MTSRRFTFTLTAPGLPARIGRGFALVLLLLAGVAGLGLHELQAQGKRQLQQVQADRLRHQQALEMLDAIAQVGLQARQALLGTEVDSAVARSRLGDAQDRALALEQALRAQGDRPAPLWLAGLLDGLTTTRGQSTQLLDEALSQSRDGRPAEALRTFHSRGQVAEALWRSQAEELQRQLGQQVQAAQGRAEEASQRQWLQYFAWGLTALLLGLLVAWRAVRQTREELERRLRTLATRDNPLAAAPAATPAVAQEAPPSVPARGARVASGFPAAPAFQNARARSGRSLGLPSRAAAGDWSALDNVAGALTRAGSSVLGAGAAHALVPGGPGGSGAPTLPVKPNGEPAAEPAVQAGAGAASSPPPADALVAAAPAAPATTAPLRPREELVRDAVAAATRSGLVVSQVVANMEDIGATGRRIAEIVAVIDSIAFQTNLLALNAMVEAAHGDAQGAAGGAAADVRNLAQRATQAAREIKALISAGVPTGPGEGAGSTFGSAGVTAALQQDASQTMDALLASVQQAADLIGQVHRAAEGGVAANLPVVVQSVEQLDRMQRNHAALVEQSAGTAEALRLQAERLQKVLGAFKLLQQTQQAAWSAHTAIRTARERSRDQVGDSGLGGFVPDLPGRADSALRPGRSLGRPGSAPRPGGDETPGSGWTPF